MPQRQQQRKGRSTATVGAENQKLYISLQTPTDGATSNAKSVRSGVPLIFTIFRYQWGSLTIVRHAYGKSKTGFGISVALIETRREPFEVYLVIYSSKMKIWHIYAFLGTLNI